jgi:hypothetical protein
VKPHLNEGILLAWFYPRSRPVFMPLLSSLLKRSNLIRRFFVAILGIAVLLLILRLGINPVPAQPSSLPSPSFKTLTTVPSTAQQVRVGLYPINVYALDISSNTYYMDTYIWFKWKGKIDPIANLELINSVEDWGMTQKTGYETPQKQPDGSLYQIVRVEGRFSQTYNLAKFPLDRQQLGITLENSIYTATDLVYVADRKDTGYADTLSLQGWQINGWNIQDLLHTYPSNFGLTVPDVAPYSAIRYDLVVSRPLNYFIWKLMLPLVVIIASSWGALLLNPSYIESRIALPASALLTIVFLQQGYETALPEVGYLVLLDKVYVLSYLLVIAAIMETIITADWIKPKRPEDYIRVQRCDRLFLLLQLLILCSGVPLLILSS